MRDYHAAAGKITDFGTLLQPNEAKEPILSRGVRGAVLQWLEELWMEKELAAVGLEPRRRALFTGPPGGGKTTLAHHIAARLRLPMLLITAEGIGDVWQNAATRNMGDLFAALTAEQRPLLVFFDEFDAIAGGREDLRNTSNKDASASVNVLLSKLERYKGLVIAATNFEAAIDSAAWRRFDIQVRLDLPGQEECERILARYLAPFVLSAPALRDLAQSLAGATPALIRQLCEGIKRQLVIGPKLGWNMGKEAAFERVVASVRPHPSLTPPQFWLSGGTAAGIAGLSWPLARGDAASNGASNGASVKEAA